MMLLANGVAVRHKCQLCLVKYSQRPNRLCWTCYKTPEGRALPPISKYGRRGSGVLGLGIRPAETPTLYLPGTPGKMAVMMWRAADGQAVFHPMDARAE